MAAREPDAPPVGEELHLPSPSLMPVLNAAGVVLALLGLTLGRGLIVVGLLLFLVTLVLWIRDVSRDIDELPGDPH
ncbi:MAG TPA: hypothetical protein VES79_08150 [Solirubrobacteraceae bacterium]|nr:hypothetical protein [Solirubrobacteraceae bacterium]